MERIRSSIGLFTGPLSWLVLYSFPTSLPSDQQSLAAILALVFIFWVTEAIPLPVTALLGPTLAIILGVATAQEAFAPFADPLIFLFIGSFILANAIFQHRLDRRVAYSILSIQAVGQSTSRILLAFGSICFVASMWLSSTATTAMMFPIGLALLSFLKKQASFDTRYATGLMLMTSFGSLIGGMATPVGTPPNLITMAMLREIHGYELSFFSWMLFAVPISLVLFAWCFFFLNRACPSGVSDLSDSLQMLQEERRKLGTLNRGQKNVIAAFSTTVCLWIAPGLLALIGGSNNQLYQFLSTYFPESVAAMVGVFLLFLLPLDWKKRQFTLTWPNAVKIDWGTLLLFGGGLSMGKLVFSTGLAETLGASLLVLVPTGSSTELALVAVTFLASLFTLTLTVIVSNTATTNMAMPTVLALTTSLGVGFLQPALAACLAASLAFLLPVSTPPSAIVFASGMIPITRMVRYGILLAVVGVLIVDLGILLLIPWI